MSHNFHFELSYVTSGCLTDTSLVVGCFVRSFCFPCLLSTASCYPFGHISLCAQTMRSIDIWFKSAVLNTYFRNRNQWKTPSAGAAYPDGYIQWNYIDEILQGKQFGELKINSRTQNGRKKRIQFQHLQKMRNANRIELLRGSEGFSGFWMCLPKRDWKPNHSYTHMHQMYIIGKFLSFTSCNSHTHAYTYSV